jgi:pSer/pThr/pTyr-binding forkhead associated (FHA) protein
MIYGPTLFSLIERVGDDAQVAANGVVAGDSFGNGHFLTSGGAMTGMIGHSSRVLEYWQSRDAGTAPTAALRRLADRIREDTHAWLQVSAKEYSQAVPINFGAQRIEQISKASGIDASARANAIDAVRRQRHALLPLDPSNWRRLFVRNGRVLSALPEMDTDHPLHRPERVASLLAVMKSIPNQASSKPSTQQEPKEGEQTLLRPRRSTEQEPKESEQTLLRPRRSTGQDLKEGEQTLLRSTPTLSMGLVVPQSATTYAFLDIEQNEGAVQRIPIKENAVIVGRVDRARGITPDIDLTPFDPSSSVSRQHARIRLGKTSFSIEDLNSRNKTRLGEVTLTPLKPEVLHNGDVVGFGRVKATFRLLGTSQLPVPWSPS